MRKVVRSNKSFNQGAPIYSAFSHSSFQSKHNNMNPP